MKKRVTGVLLGLCLVCSLLPGAATAEAANSASSTIEVPQSDADSQTDSVLQSDDDSQSAVSLESEEDLEFAVENNNGAPINVSDGKALVESSNTEYDSLDEAMAAASDTDTIYLGAGTYCGNSASPTEQGSGAGKNLTFVGAGTDKTTWQIRALNTPAVASDGPCDYSFRGSDSITFQDMTIVGSVYSDGTKAQNTQGLTYINHITLKDCTFNGRADYWGYESTVFENVTFNAPGTEASGISGKDYSLWIYTGKSYIFRNCTFNSIGKTINVYRHASPGYDVTVNFESCNVKNTAHHKQALKINDSTMGNDKYIINISGDNTVEGIEPNQITCSRLFGFDEAGENTGKTIVKMENTTVWENGNRTVEHNHDFATGSYSNGVAEDSANKYTDGYKDDAFTTVYGDWTENPDGSKTRTVTKTCSYCGYVESYEESVTPTPTPTVEPTSTPTATPTATPTVEPTIAPTIVPTVVPTATPTVAPTVTPTSVATTTDTSPKTGDDSHVALWIGLCAAGALALALGSMSFYRRKKR